MYKVAYTHGAEKQLAKLDRHTRSLVLNWIEKNLVNCDDPRRHGKALIANRSGQWRYRIGDYRLICEIQDARLVILALAVGHRREVYEE